LAQVAPVGRVRRQLGIARDDSTQAGLHPERRADEREVERHGKANASLNIKGPALRALFRSGVGPYTRFLYSWVRVSISTLSPVWTNSGTEICRPVASLALFSTLPEVSPLTAGSVSVI